MISAHITQPLLTAAQRVARENMERHLSPEFVGSETTPAAPMYANVQCSQCGGEFGPGPSGFSHCQSHRDKLIGWELDFIGYFDRRDSALIAKGLSYAERKIMLNLEGADWRKKYQSRLSAPTNDPSLGRLEA